MQPVSVVILAAGKGTRAYPYTREIPKSLLEVDGKTILQRNIEILRDQVGIRDVLIVVGYKADLIEETFGLDLPVFEHDNMVCTL